MRPMLPLAAVALSLVACRSRPEPQDSAATASAAAPPPSEAPTAASAARPPPGEAASSPPLDASPPRWAAAAARAPAPLAKRAEEVRGRAVTKSTPEIDAALDAAAARPATAAGLREAAKLLEDESQRPHDRGWAGSGTGPSAMRLHAGGIAVLADLAQRACAARPKDAAVVRAIDEIPLPPIFNSGGVDKAQVERMRDALRDAAKGCGGRAKGLDL